MDLGSESDLSILAGSRRSGASPVSLGSHRCSRQCYPMRVMGITEVLRKVFLVDLIQGLGVTFRYQDPKEIYTEQYPLERPQVAERYRGAPRLNVNPDTDETLCIACDLCALACPENLIVVTSERNEKTRRKELTNFTYDLSRCMFCGLCEDACPDRCARTHPGFRARELQPRGHDLGPPGAGEGSAAHRVQEVAGPQPVLQVRFVSGRPLGKPYLMSDFDALSLNRRRKNATRPRKAHRRR